MNTKKIATLTLVLFLTGMASAQTQTPDQQTDQTNRPTVTMEAVLINTDPVPVQSGEDAEIFFKVRNTGNTEAENVEVTIPDSFPFELKPDTQRNYELGTLQPGHEYYITAEVLVAEDAPDGSNGFEVEVTQGDYTSIKDVPVQVQNQDIEMNLANLQTVPSQLTPDMEDAKLRIETVNNGEKAAENTILRIGLPETFQETSSFSTRQSLGNVAPGQVKMAEFTFDIEEFAESGTVEIPANITYSTGDSSTRITEPVDFSFHLAGRPQYEVVSTESDLRTGGSGTLEITVRNTGSEESSSTRIRVLDSSDLPFSYGSSSKYIGTLEPGKEGTAVFDITTESNAAVKNYLLDFEIRGVKGSEVYVEDTTVQTEVSDGGDTGGSFPILPAALIVAVLGAAFYFRDRIKDLL